MLRERAGSIADEAKARQFMLELKQLGCRFGLDDLGSGLSSFDYLRRLPVDYLKIDGSFINGILECPVDLAMVESIHRIAEILGIFTNVECVDSVPLLDALRELNLGAARGHAVHRPEPIHRVVEDYRTRVRAG